MLQWNRDWGTNIETWENKIKAGQRAPDGFLERPDVLPVSMFYQQAFSDLATERAIGMSVGPIPRSKALGYAREHGIDDPDELDQFWSIIHKLDNCESSLNLSTKKDQRTRGGKKMPGPLNANRPNRRN